MTCWKPSGKAVPSKLRVILQPAECRLLTVFHQIPFFLFHVFFSVDSEFLNCSCLSCCFSLHPSRRFLSLSRAHSAVLILSTCRLGAVPLLNLRVNHLKTKPSHSSRLCPGQLGNLRLPHSVTLRSHRGAGEVGPPVRPTQPTHDRFKQFFPWWPNYAATTLRWLLARARIGMKSLRLE